MPHADANLLFAALALQMGFITLGQFTAATAQWAKDPTKTVAQVLLQQHAIDERTCDLIQRHVDQQLNQCPGGEEGPDATGAWTPGHENPTPLSDPQNDDDAKPPGTAGRQADATIDFKPAGAGPMESTAPWPNSDRVDDRFRLLRFHAQGGLGRVMVALDEQLNREVALKDLLEYCADDPHYRSRFVMEAEITGSLEHPNIVPVYAQGRYANGRPYYAMRFVRGDSLKQAIERFHHEVVAVGDPARQRLELRRLLRHFLDACNAMHYAHSRGVLHRDIKPGNIMLGKYGETMLMDWGLAKSVRRPEDLLVDDELTLHPASGGSSLPTQMGSVLGTPAYMSPEQAQGNLDQLSPATDVFSLGATLYSLLTNRAPFQDKDRGKLLEKVRRCQFVRPRETHAWIPTGLEAICLKAMQAAAAARYPHCRALAQDIEHWLADEPIVARPDTPLERVLRWIRHHRSWAFAGTAALVLIAITATVATFRVNEARHRAVELAERNRTLAEEEKAARQEAVRRFQEARESVDAWLTGTSEALTYYPGVQDARRRLLQKAAEDYERFARDHGEDAELETEHGRAMLRLGDVRRLLNETAQAEASYRAAQAVFEELTRRQPELFETQLELANSRIRLGMLLADTGQPSVAAAAFDQAVDALSALAQEHGDDPRLRHAVASGQVNRASLHLAAGRLEAAEQVVQRALSQLDRLSQERSARPEYRVDATVARTLYSEILVRGGRLDDALAQLAPGFALLDNLVQRDPSNPKYYESRAAARIHQASILRNLGQPDAELEAYRSAASDYQAIAKAMPDVPRFEESLALTHCDRGQLLHELGRTREAEDALGQALAVFTRLADANRQIPRYREGRAACRDILGQVLRDRGRDEDALASGTDAVSTYEELLKSQPDGPHYQQRLAIARSHLAQVLHRLGRHAEALQAFEKSAHEMEDLMKLAPAIPEYRDDLAFVCGNQVGLLQDMHKPQESQQALDRAKRLWEELIGQSPAPEYRHHLARYLVRQLNCPPVDAARAATLAQQTIEASPANGGYWTVLGMAQYRLGAWQSARATLQKAADLSLGANAEALLFLAMSQYRLAAHAEAAKTCQRACQWIDTNCPGNPVLKRARDEATALGVR